MKIHPLWPTGYCIFLLAFTVQCQLLRSPARQQQAPVQQLQPQDDNLPEQQDDNLPQPQDDNLPQPQDDNLPQPQDDNLPQPQDDDLPQQQDNNLPAAPFQLEGIWVAQVETEYGTVYSELILEYTRTFSQQVVLNDLMTYDTGTYVVGDGFIHFTVENHEPKVYKGKEMTWVNSFTYFYTPVDANSMVFEDHIAGTTWTVYRK